MACKNLGAHRLGNVRGALALGLPLVCASVTTAHAQIRTDGTLGGPPVALAGPNFLIDQALGRLAGSNLFHSFQVFNVGSAESATFVTTTPALANVISRVTGGTASQINGLVKLESANAAPNFVFINPAGVVFGKGAQINVPAGFHVSTANYVKFPDGNFYADPNAASTLSSAAPEAFGFLGTTRATIAIRDGATLETLSTGADQPLSVVAGDIDIDGARVQTFGGVIRAVAVGSGAQEVGLTGALPDASGSLAILNGGQLFSRTSGAMRAGDLLVSAGDLEIDGHGNPNLTGITSQATAGSGGNAGRVDVTASGRLSITNGGAISSDTSASGQAGTVKVVAGDLEIDGQGNFTGITSQAKSGSRGNAGSVDVTARGRLSITNGGEITSSTYSSGQAGTVKVVAGDLVIDGQGNPDSFTGITSQANPDSSGDAGSVDVTASGRLSMTNLGVIDSSTNGSGRGGSVRVTAGALSITNGGGITSGTASSGQAGTVKVVVAGDLEVDGRDSPYPTVIASQANYGSTGDAGSVDVTAGGRLSIISGGEISSNTASPGQAGTVKIVAGDLRIDAQGSAYFTGIGSQANRDSTGGTANAGNARSVDVTARGRLSITNDGQIDSSTETSGQAGTVTVTAGELSITSGGRISSSTFSSGPAGTVKVVAGDLEIDRQGSPYFTGIASQANSESTGDAGSVDIIASGRLSITNGGRVSSRTFSSGQAGTVAVTAGELSITIGGRISSSTSASGRGGSVGVNAGTIVADSSSLIDAVAAGGSSGQTGTLTVAASERITLYNGASFSIRNDATVDQPGSLDQSLLTVSAPYITLSNGGQITAASSGNVAASNIAVNFGPQMTVTNAGISTSAKDGNGGRIALSSPIGGAGALVLQDGQVTTSVTGTKGNGGDISVAAPILVMQTGFIQANTAAANARGGDVSIRVGTLLPSGGTLFVGGATPYAFAPGVFGFNVIQAAAPDGVSGTIRISTPVLDITRSLSALPGGYLDTGGLGRSPCAIVGGSSLSQGGRGGLPPAAGDLLWLDPVYEVATVPAPGWQGLIALSPKAPGSARAGALPTIRCRPLQS